MSHPDQDLGSEIDPAISTIYHTLRAPRRRLIVGLIARHTLFDNSTAPDRSQIEAVDQPYRETTTARELARSIVAIEQDIPPENATGEEYHATYTALVQTHLPQLNEAGVIEFDSDRKTVESRENLFLAFIISSVTTPLIHRFFQEDNTRVFDRSGEPADSVTHL